MNFIEFPHVSIAVMLMLCVPFANVHEAVFLIWNEKFLKPRPPSPVSTLLSSPLVVKKAYLLHPDSTPLPAATVPSTLTFILASLFNSFIDQLIIGLVSVVFVLLTEIVPFIVMVGTVVSLICIVKFFTFVVLTFPSVSFAIILKLTFLPSNSL